MTRDSSTTSRFCVIVTVVVLIGLTTAEEQVSGDTCGKDDDCVRSRQRRADCSGSIYTMTHLVKTIEQLETKDTGKTPKEYAGYLRKFMYANLRFLSRQQWNYACSQFTASSMSDEALKKKEQEDLALMIRHGNDVITGRETGVVLTKLSGTVAAGHVVTGISCGGFARETNMKAAKWWAGATSNMDNLFFVTISGDVGQTSLLFYSNENIHELFGPAGKWDDPSCPKEYILSSTPVSELTEAEVNGDMDGVILGTLIPMINDRRWKLSGLFRDYYQNDGIRVGKRLFSATNRKEIFGELVSDVELEAQSRAFAEAYYGRHEDRYNGRSLPSLLHHIPEAIQKFYKDYVPCTGKLKTKYTIQYFLKLVKELEDENKSGATKITRDIVGMSEYFTESHLGIMLTIRKNGPKYTDHFAWYVLRELVSHGFSHGFSPSDRRRELGVIEAGGDVVAIGHVIAGIHAAMDRKSLYGATVAGSLARAAVGRHQAPIKTSPTMGATGRWDRSKCPIIKYRLTRSIKSAQHTTRAELLGDIDGFVLGRRVSDWLKAEPRLKLSTALERYYGKSFNPVSSQVRFEQFKTYVDKSKLITETKIACEKIVERNTAWYVGSETDFCAGAAKAAVNEFYKTVPLSKDEAKTSYESKMLPDYNTLVAAYPGDRAKGGVISGADLRSKLAGNRIIDKSQKAVDSLRISAMLNKMFGHRIPMTETQNSVIRDGRVYIYDLATLKSYLTTKYKAPLSEISGKSGILMLESSDGSGLSVGLWNGRKMHQIADRNSQSGVTRYLWQTHGCSTLNDAGSCNFYKCINWASHCGTSGYVLGYGYRYCRQFYSLYDKFDKEGQLWLKDVRQCLMDTVEMLHKRQLGCDDFRRVAFDSHADCYKGSKHFCKMASAEKNRDLLFVIFEPDKRWDFWGHDAWTKMLDTLTFCQKHVTKKVLENIIEYIKQGRKKLEKSLSSKQQDEGYKTASVETESSQCVAYANVGDCRFYECFHRKFPCSVFDASHVTDFEFPLCRDLQNQNLMLDTKGGRWLTNSNKCLMAKLLPLYRQDSVSCVDLRSVMFDGRSDCLVKSGLCDVIASQRNSFAVNLGMNLCSYPSVLPDKSGLTLAGRDYFYSELSSLRRLLGHAASVCA